MRFIYLSLTSLLLSTQLIHADIIMGVVPQQSPLKLQKVWRPIAEYLSDKTGQKVIFKTEKSIAEFEKVLYSGGYDFAYMNPYHYVVAHKKQAYHAKVRADKNIRGILVMKKGSGIEQLKSKDTRYLFPSPNAFAATLLTKYELIETFKVDPKVLQKARYVNSHDSVYKAISRDIGDVGGGIERTFRNMNDRQTKENLHVVHRTKAYPSHPFAFRPDLKEETTQRIVEALLQMPATLLKPLSIKALHQIDDSEYKSVEELAVLLNIMPR
jgi:phosphonate transport system substrate-binding protein